jgi:hypothetical protein
MNIRAKQPLIAGRPSRFRGKRRVLYHRSAIAYRNFYLILTSSLALIRPMTW